MTMRKNGLLLFVLDVSVAVGHQQLVEVINLLFELFSYIGVAHPHTALAQFENDVGRDNVDTVFDGLLSRLERLVLHQLQTPRMEDERVAGNTGLGLVGLGEATVDYQQFTAGLDGIFASEGLDRCMRVEHMV